VVSASDVNTAPDHVYALTVHAAGDLFVTLTPDAGFDGMLVGRTKCTDPTTQGGIDYCGNEGAAGHAEAMTFPVTEDQTVYIAVDGVGGSKGTYSIKFELL
jgi:hypothetical protein